MIDLDYYEPTKEELADPGWWKANVPEGATHYLPDQAGVSQAYIKETENTLYYSYGTCREWTHWGTKQMKERYTFIQRPKEKKFMKGSDKVMIELKETSAKAQKQLEDLENELN